MGGGIWLRLGTTFSSLVSDTRDFWSRDFALPPILIETQNFTVMVFPVASSLPAGGLPGSLSSATDLLVLMML